MKRPAKRSREPDVWKQSGNDQYREQSRTDETVERVVDWNSPGSELALLQAPVDASEESKVGHDDESEREPSSAMVLNLENGPGQQGRGCGSPGETTRDAANE